MEETSIDDLLPLNISKSKTFKRSGKAGIFAGSLELAKEGNISIKQNNLFDDNFIKSIQDIAVSIENEDSVSLMENFNIMASNCGTCHKKFRN